MKKKTKSLFLFGVAFAWLALAPFGAARAQTSEELFRARVLETVGEQVEVTGSGQRLTQREIKVRVLSGSQKGEELTIRGRDDIKVLSVGQYEVGQKVMVTASVGPEGEPVYFITDHVRTGTLWWLFLLFILCVLAVGRKRGLRALIVLLCTFILLLYVLVPRILAGDNPVVVTVLISTLIMALAIFGTEGFGKKSRIAFQAILLSLAFILLASYFFTKWAKLSGFLDESALLLTGLGFGNLNFEGLLLSGFIIGALGVLDDIIINQVSLVHELRQSNPAMSRKALFATAMRVGRDHINAVVNTLVLAYAGVSLPLLLLFSIKQPPFLHFTDVINNELVSTEIVRTLVGTIGLILSMPLATWLAVSQLAKQKEIPAQTGKE